MKFAEKLKAARLDKGYTQKQLAEISHVALRTIVSYEKGDSYPRKRETYAELAKALDVEKNYLLTEDEEFVVNAAEQYGTNGAAQAQAVINGFSGLCAGGTLSENDKDAVMKALQDIYWESKARNVQKYTPKKFKKP
ncbi:helix-turn-helix domain-containing protein [Oscillibacter valericigenes]|jgi:toxin-antitoxin system, antitoxin component, xre family|nr:helix-turn-helix domain-containing protein [Oscillibacter valericigenes]